MCYEWHVKVEGRKISGNHHFRILTEKESANIRSQLKEVAGKHACQCPELKQALYLQVISDATPGIDIYADSLRLVKEYKDEERCASLSDAVSKRIFEHRLGGD